MTQSPASTPSDAAIDSAPGLRIHLRLFASVREALGCAEQELILPPNVTTVQELRVWLRQRDPVWAAALAETRALRMAYNQQMCDGATRLQDGAEVAFFPPVTGG